jgi:hypothetical protein
LYAPFYAAGLVVRYGFYYLVVAPIEVFNRTVAYGASGGVDGQRREARSDDSHDEGCRSSRAPDRAAGTRRARRVRGGGGRGGGHGHGGWGHGGGCTVMVTDIFTGGFYGPSIFIGGYWIRSARAYYSYPYYYPYYPYPGPYSYPAYPPSAETGRSLRP